MYTTIIVMVSAIARFLIWLNLWGKYSLYTAAHAIKAIIGTSSGCIRKLSRKLPVKNNNPDLVSPQPGHGSPKSIMVGETCPKIMFARIKYSATNPATIIRGGVIRFLIEFSILHTSALRNIS